MVHSSAIDDPAVATRASQLSADARRSQPDGRGIGVTLMAASVTARDGRRLLESIELAIAPGERLAIVGPNGAGKTTLLRLIIGRLTPSAGHVTLNGSPLGQISLHERARLVAIVGQSDQPDLRMRLIDYVGLGRIPHRQRVGAAEHRRVIARSIDQVGLGALLDRPLASLSGGERQRASIARAITQEPAVLVLDEPTNHLDPRARADLLDLARGLGVTVIAVLHDLALVAPFADRVAVLQAGRLIAHGPAADALRPAIVRAVFDMDCFPFTNPVTGRSLMVFDTPAG